VRTAELMRRAAVSRDTLRFYERRGLLSRPRRAANGYRDYPESALDEIRFVKLAQSVGFPLRTIAAAIPYVANPKPGCPRLRDALHEQLAAVDERIGELQNARQRLVLWLAANAAAAESTQRSRASARPGRPRRSTSGKSKS
jgi:MerR family copper efflux transcriptional regulator